MRMLVPHTVTSAIARPIAKLENRLVGVTANFRPTMPAITGAKMPSVARTTTPPDPDAGQDAERRGHHRIRRAFEAEHAHEMPACEAERTKRPQLGLPLLGEHHERVDEEQHTGDDDEAADQSEQPRERVSLPVGELERLLLLVGDLDRSESGGTDLQLEHDGVARAGAVEDTALVRHEHSAFGQQRAGRRGLCHRRERARRDEDVLRAASRSQGGTRRDRGAARRCARQRTLLPYANSADPIAGTDVQPVGKIDADHRFVAGRRRARVGESGGCRVAAERAAFVEVDLLRERVRLREAEHRSRSRPRLRRWRSLPKGSHPFRVAARW